MSRISRYQESIKKFIKNRSSIKNLDVKSRNDIYELIESDGDLFLPIILLTLLNSQSKKERMAIHGYYMACASELMNIVCKINDNVDNYKKYDLNYLYRRISSMINICLSENIEYVTNKENKERMLKRMHYLTRIINERINSIYDNHRIETEDIINKTDIHKYKYKNIKDPKSLIKKIKRINQGNLENYINNKYCNISFISCISGWLIGGGDDKKEDIINNIEKLSYNLGFILKISYDFKNMENDLLNSKDYTYNYVINNGIQKSFEDYLKYKNNFIKYAVVLDVYSNTMKEIIDVLEIYVDNFIDEIDNDLRSQITI